MKVFKLAQIARRDVEKFFPDYGPDLAGLCAISSYHLNRLALKNGIKIWIFYGRYNGEFHFWNEHYGKVIDITLTQFGNKEKIYYSSNNYNYKALDYGLDAGVIGEYFESIYYEGLYKRIRKIKLS